MTIGLKQWIIEVLYKRVSRKKEKKTKAAILHIRSEMKPRHIVCEVPSLTVTRRRCLHRRYYFWLVWVRLEAQSWLFYFTCHNAMVEFSLRGIVAIGKANNICCVSNASLCFIPLAQMTSELSSAKGWGAEGQHSVFVTDTLVYLKSDNRVYPEKKRKG